MLPLWELATNIPMKPRILFLLAFLFVLFNASTPVDNDVTTAYDYTGAWESSFEDENGRKIKAITILMDGFIAETWVDASNNHFIRTQGGSWTIDNNKFTLLIEFNSSDSSTVGSTIEANFERKGDQVKFEEDTKVWTRIDKGKKGDLAGAWLFAGRKKDGEITRREPSQRKTMKILSKTRFQWIAFHTGTGKFSGTGGGTYTAKKGKYVENIDFFSRDNSRVGASLSFDFDVKDGEWHHSGLSSKGNPIYEIWAPRKE